MSHIVTVNGKPAYAISGSGNVKHFSDKVSVSKKELAKVKPGTWLHIKWNDAPISVGLMIEKPDMKERGEVSVRCFFPEMRDVRNIVHTQIVMVGERVAVPVPMDQH